MRDLGTFILAMANAALDERELRKKQLHASVYDPGVIPGTWRKENMNDFSNLGAFVEKKCKIFPNVTWQVAPGTLDDLHYFSSDWVANFGKKQRVHGEYKESEWKLNCADNETVHVR